MTGVRLNGVNWNWKVCTTHGALDRVTLHMDHLFTTPQMDYSTDQRFQTHWALCVHHLLQVPIKMCDVQHRLSAILISNTDMESHRDQKRQSSKKNSDYGVYTKKAVRAKEALLEKKLSCPAKVKGRSK
jgi:hypothetical protein